MSTTENPKADTAAANPTEEMDRMLDTMTQKKPENDSQFQKLGDVVEGEDDNGVVEIESLCMNCHENVCFLINLSLGLSLITVGNNSTTPSSYSSLS